MDAETPNPDLSHLTLHLALPYPDLPFDERTRKALSNALINLWGECSVRVPDYDKKAWNAVMGQLKQIGAIDW